MALDINQAFKVLNPGDFQQANDQHALAAQQHQENSLKIAHAQNDAILERLSGTNDQQAWDNNLNWAKANNIDTSGLPQQFDPQVRDQLINRSLMFRQRMSGKSSARPATLQIADALASADPATRNNILLAGKLTDKGVVYDENGMPVAQRGYGDAIGSIEGTKAAYKERGQKGVDLSLIRKLHVVNKINVTPQIWILNRVRNIILIKLARKLRGK